MAKRALIVDDSRIGRKMVMRSLPPNWDVELLEACDGEEAINILTVNEIDVVFLDLTMPKLDGYEVLRWLKRREKPPIVIVVSGDLQPAAKVRVLLMGAFEFVPKPPQPEQVEDALKLAGVLR